jgi:Uma2 family endonuclease
LTVVLKPSLSAEPEPPELHSGDRLSREEFHRIYEQMPESFKAELVGGIVYVASPLRIPHATNHPFLSALLLAYSVRTPGVQVGDNATVLLGDEGEPQPDLFLRILPESGGQSRTTEDEYVDGAPELVVEIAHSSRALDLHGKKEDYAKYGVREYVVWSLADFRLDWFDLAGGQALLAGTDGILRIHSFPGLWIDAFALGAQQYDRMMATLQQGLDTPEHAAFVEQLARAKTQA